MKHLKLIALLFKIRSLEIFLDGQACAMALVADQKVRSDIQVARANAMLELTQMKAEYRRIKRGNGIKAMTLPGGCEPTI